MKALAITYIPLAILAMTLFSTGRNKKFFYAHAFAIACTALGVMLFELTRVSWLIRSGEFWEWYAFQAKNFDQAFFMPHVFLSFVLVFLPVLNFKEVNRENMGLQRGILLVNIAYLAFELYRLNEGISIPGWGHRAMIEVPFVWMLAAVASILLLVNILVIRYNLLPEFNAHD